MPHENTGERVPSLTRLNTQPGGQLYKAKFDRSDISTQLGFDDGNAIFRVTFSMALEWEPVSQGSEERESSNLLERDASKVIRDALNKPVYDEKGELILESRVFYSSVVFQTTGQPQGFSKRNFSFTTKARNGTVSSPRFFESEFNDYVVNRSMA